MKTDRLDKPFLGLLALVFHLAGLSVNVNGQDVREPEAEVKETVVEVEDDVGAGAPAPAAAGSSSAVDSSGYGFLPDNRRLYLRPHPERDTLTDHYFGLGQQLSEVGIESTLNVWASYQGVVAGGLESDDGSSGFYRFANHFDLEKMFGLSGAAMYVRIDGSWDDDINDAVGALVPVNSLTEGDERIGVTHLWFEQMLFEKRFRFRVGKQDVSEMSFDFHGQNVSFDAMPYGNFEGTQFIDLGLVNTANIPFPDSGPGAAMLLEPLERVYLAAATVSTSADAFHFFDADDFNKWMILVETGFVTPPGDLPGLYYAGYWFSEFEDAASAHGVYLGMAQLVVREPGTHQQGLGMSARYGYATDRPIKHFWSLAAQYEGLLPGRDRDVLAVGWAQSFTSGSAFDRPYEGALEAYYRARVTPWLHVSPHIQYIANPGSSDLDDALTLGVRAQVTF